MQPAAASSRPPDPLPNSTIAGVPELAPAAPEPIAPATLRIHAPANGAFLGEVPIDSEAVVRERVARARTAQGAWGRLSVRERCRALRAVRVAIAGRIEEFAEAVAQENGKPLQEALTHDLMPPLDLVAYYESRAPDILAPERIPLHFVVNRASYLHCVPRGVVGVIGPWNFPFSIPFGDAFMALFAGNAVVVKPSEVTPLIAVRFKALWDEVCRSEPRLTPDLLQIVTGTGAAGAALCRSGVNCIMFTGSVPTGRKVAVACAEQLIPAVLELGGINPAIVTADVDIERTAHALAWGGFANSGQVCASVSRVYVDRRIEAPLTERVVQIVSALRQGDPLAHDTDIGAMTFQPQIGIGKAILDDTVRRGGRVRCGGEIDGRFFRPTVIDQVQHGWPITQDESFSPLLAFVPYDDLEQAVRWANDSDKGLMAYVYSGDEAAGRKIAERLEAGTAMVNNALETHAMPGTPWQGVKTSGLGEVHSHKGLRDLCQVRHVNYRRGWVPWVSRELWWYPYSKKGYEFWIRVIRTMWGGGMVDRILRVLGR
ncbi:MAG: aldehyde dehydrogenase family protein [Myxococcales bacterium]|nr:aldehyde dehydrogenase family protein [Myxococcales bacterium]